MATTDRTGAAVVVFITGQQDCTQDDFDLYYAPAIESALKEGYSFAVGNAAGVDAFAKKLLWDVHHCARVTIYDKGAKTGDIPEGSGWALKNGFDSYPDRDFQMMLDSNKIVCYLFGNSGGTGTHRNLLLFFALKTAPPQARLEDLRLHPDQVLQLNRKCHRGGLWDLKGWQLD
jgi:hypothetical protein